MKTTLLRALLAGAIFCTLSAQSQSVDFESSNLPIIIIDTEGRTIVNEPKVKARMGIINNPEGITNNISGPFTDYDGFIGIEFRGSSSQALFPKKSFGIETWDDQGQDLDTAILGFPAEEDWVLHGPYSDKTLMRNKLTFDLFSFTERYSSRTKYVEVVLNGQYHGIYLFMEKVKRDKNRVDIANLKPEDNEGEELTGGYILKLDKFDGSGGGGFASEYRPNNYKNSDQVAFFQYDEPADDEITSAQKAYIQSFMKSFESALKSSSFRDPVSGYRKYIELSSFVDFFLINELSRNVDGYRLSTFMYKDKDDKGGLLTLGPIWDFNLAFGNADYCQGGNTQGWAYKFNDICPNDFWLVPFWWDKLMTDPVFRQQVKLRWMTLRSGAWSDEAISTMIDEYTDVLSEAKNRNFQRWPVIGQYTWPNNFVGATYMAEVDYLRNWITQRTTWLDQQIENFEGPMDVTGLSNREVDLVTFPNPFVDLIYFQNEAPAGVESIKIFSFSGQQVRTINNRGKLGSKLTWDGRNSNGEELPPAVYLYQAFSGDGKVTVGKIIKSAR
ncbi:CotH kinase family protein [Imperialibacter roseus]|uniref:CotH kinase family protein n=1 Tax=Imperialibacter roseus TaxID=1324217 RepID=A0ABZ0IN52_9BACT|nr:CotH kinase family protein [Imperialibacter roseus]WOK06151.1 CotH kinase family protein [Imperialibacter roseus]